MYSAQVQQFQVQTVLPRAAQASTRSEVRLQQAVLKWPQASGLAQIQFLGAEQVRPQVLPQGLLQVLKVLVLLPVLQSVRQARGLLPVPALVQPEPERRRRFRGWCAVGRPKHCL